MVASSPGGDDPLSDANDAAMVASSPGGDDPPSDADGAAMVASSPDGDALSSPMLADAKAGALSADALLGASAAVESSTIVATSVGAATNAAPHW
jgi:hypothetical protein